jgi:hypothetical protein
MYLEFDSSIQDADNDKADVMEVVYLTSTMAGRLSQSSNAIHDGSWLCRAGLLTPGAGRLDFATCERQGKHRSKPR